MASRLVLGAPCFVRRARNALALASISHDPM